MSKFIKLTTYDGSSAVFNTSFFVVVYKHGKLTRIVFDGKGEDSELVKETPEQILALINGQDNSTYDYRVDELIRSKIKLREIEAQIDNADITMDETCFRINEILHREDGK